ncbi:MAG: hypothetical protein SH821_06035 [Phototrophicales bacterium]|nr:hypothetical protein [Phototrophicales bacterium]
MNDDVYDNYRIRMEWSSQNDPNVITVTIRSKEGSWQNVVIYNITLP